MTVLCLLWHRSAMQSHSKRLWNILLNYSKREYRCRKKPGVSGRKLRNWMLPSCKMFSGNCYCFFLCSSALVNNSRYLYQVVCQLAVGYCKEAEYQWITMKTQNSHKMSIVLIFIELWASMQSDNMIKNRLECFSVLTHEDYFKSEILLCTAA